MNQLERFRATVRRERPDGILFEARFTDDLRDRMVDALGTEDLAGALGLFEPVEVAPEAPPGYEPPDYGRYYEGRDLPEGTSLDDNGVAMVPSGFYHFYGYVSPLRNAASFDEIESYPLEKDAAFATEHMAGQVEAAHAAGLVARTWVGHMYETAWQVRGLEQFLEDLIERPEWCECLLDKLTRRNVAWAEAAARAGVDFILTGDDVASQRGMLFSPDTWRRLMKPRWEAVYRAAQRTNPDIQIYYHSDGDIEGIIPELIEIGVRILDPIQPECMDPAHIKREFGDRLILHGTVGTQTTMPFGTPEDVRAVVKERIETLGRDGGLILGPTHVLEPEVPIENVKAYSQACRQYGGRGGD